jgi:RNA-directed DNA polymerase
VTANQGKWTAGVDKIIWETPEKKAMAVSTWRQHGYRAVPWHRVYIPKYGGMGQRPLSIPCRKDRAMQAPYWLALDLSAETLAEPTSYGLRLARSPADAIDQCQRVLSLRWSAQGILAGDMHSCFDRISLEWLLANIPMEQAILRPWLPHTDLRDGGSSHLHPAVAVGTAAASAQSSWVDQGEILSV